MDDPYDLIRFDAHIPVPVSIDPTNYDYQRARVTIDSFELETREELLRERTRLIFSLCFMLKSAQAGNINGPRGVNMLLSPASPHSNCLQCYARLFAMNQAKAETLAEQALAYLESVGDTFVRMRQ